ncbi:HIT domain-containing protein [Pseudoclavibacter alba]|uniref:HIT domain-containing protein n=1 Tax=Pseudoclavibacter albus TaxID=272241 RepID=A0ABT2HX76_9MICO|nr:HIT domain-containing protein [Pseudoclavibacter alba]MCT2042920.1 HIT domain-containing protein [Pseudoclavibacter alba]
MSDAAEKSVFSRIVDREIPADIVAETETLIAFRDIQPQAPVHVLVVPKTAEHRNVSELAKGDPALLAELIGLAQDIADRECGGEFRLVFNTGERGGQTVFHVHAHVLGGDLSEASLGQ